MRRFHRRAAASICVVGALLISSSVAAGGDLDPAPARKGLVPTRGDDFTFCRYPSARPFGGLTNQLRANIEVPEQEPNDSEGDAQFLPFGTGAGDERDVDVSGSISSGSDVDYFLVPLRKGDVLGVTCLAQDDFFDPKLRLFSPGGDLLVANDEHGGISTIFPSSAPFTAPGREHDALLTLVAPESGFYVIRVAAVDQTDGPYRLSIRGSRPFIAEQPAPAVQLLFLDFDGAAINAQATFGEGNTNAVLSPLSDFLERWDLDNTDDTRDRIIDAIIDKVERNFDALRLAELNGDQPTDGVNGHFDVRVLNSRDDVDIFGQSNVSRVIVGGTMAELGIPTIGIAQHIDPGNFSTEDTAVVLLDLLSEDDTDPILFLDSINSVPLPPPPSFFGKDQLIGRVVGNVITHEAGHFFGNFHTDPLNSLVEVMDSGGVGVTPWAEVGPDGIAGTSDDVAMGFVPDVYFFFEFIGCDDFTNSDCGTEHTDTRTAFALSTGGEEPETDAPSLSSEFPARGSEIASLNQVTVIFDEPVTALRTPNVLRVNGSAATEVSGFGIGPFVFKGFAAPPEGQITVELVADLISDFSGNPFGGDTWLYTRVDCNGNGRRDEEDVANGTSEDCNGNGVPDECDLKDAATTAGIDCNQNGVLDECEVLEADCNGNGVPDDCDILPGFSLVSGDCNGNGLPDDCETGLEDCNANGIVDDCDPDALAAVPGPERMIEFGEKTVLGEQTPASGGTPPYTFEWTLRGNAGGQSSDDPNPTFDPAQPGNFTAKLVVKDSMGCVAVAFVNLTVMGEGASGGLSSFDQCGEGTCGTTGGMTIAAMLATYFTLRVRRSRRRR